MDSKIKTLKPGRSVTISESNGIKVVAERSSKGDVVRFVRVTDGGCVVFKQSKW